MCWVHCLPGHHQPEPIFNPSASSSYRNVPYTARACTDLPTRSRSSPGNNCVYRVNYADSSFSTGLLATETLTLTTATALPGFVFGCSQNSTAANETAGMFGLGRNFPSLLSQTPSRLGKVFSYCLPTTSNVVGHLTIGRGVARRPSYTPMLAPRPGSDGHYFVDLVGISVNGEQLPVSPTVFSRQGTVIDSGTTVSYLPAVAYRNLRDAFRRGMSHYRSVAPAQELDTCYDFNDWMKVSFPSITLHFAGSSSSSGVNLTLKPKQVFLSAGRSLNCLAFAPTRSDTLPSIVGSVQQRGMDVIYDVEQQKIGFADGNCGY